MHCLFVPAGIFARQTFNILVITIMLFAVVVNVAFADAKSDRDGPILTLKVSDEVLTPLDSGVEISLYLTNVIDSVAGFEIWLSMSDPSIMLFANEDTVLRRGEVLEDWGLMVNDPMSLGVVNKVVGMYYPPEQNYLLPTTTPIFLASLWIKVVDPQPDTLCLFSGDIIVSMIETRFSDRHGELIGWDRWTEIDTSYFNCLEWEGDSCVAWEYTVIDTTYGANPNYDSLQYDNGSYLFNCPWEYVCGDADGNEIVEVSDAVHLINYVFNSGPAPDPVFAGDVDCTGIVEISDAVYVIVYIFSSGPVPCFDCP